MLQMTHHSHEHDFVAYYKAVEGRPPRETLLYALAAFEAEPQPPTPPFAIDVGCGDGRDAVELLRRGWQVLGIDAQPEAIARLRSRPDINRDRLKTQVTRFQDLTALPANVDLINASFSLQFCPQPDFPALWQKITTALRPGGRFCGQLFGDRDSWATFPNMSHHTLEEVEKLLQPFVVEMFEEEEHPGKTALGEEKHWHIFQIVACKQ
jgi:SAM-dependent methyltransferase